MPNLVIYGGFPKKAAFLLRASGVNSAREEG